MQNQLKLEDILKRLTERNRTERKSTKRMKASLPKAFYPVNHKTL